MHQGHPTQIEQTFLYYNTPYFEYNLHDSILHIVATEFEVNWRLYYQRLV